MDLQPLPPQLADAKQQDDVTFWSERFRDHAMLLFILLDPQQANDLKMRAKQELQNWNQYLEAPNLEKLRQLIPVIAALKNEVLNRSQTGQINLVISHNDFIKLLKHMLQELIYFVQSMDQKITPEEEIAFWIRENAEHTELAGHLIPLSQLSQQNPKLAQQLQSQNIQLVQSLYQALPAQLLPIYQVSNEMAMKLDQLVQQGSQDAVQSLLHIMLEHEIKEGLRGEKRIRQLFNM